MENTELRIGNWVQSRIEVGQKWDVIVSSNDFIGNYKLFEPIKLTEDWLLKFGFERYEFDNGEPNQYRFKNRLIVIRKNVFYDYGTGVKIEFVHKLQNLFFELNEELTVI